VAGAGQQDPPFHTHLELVVIDRPQHINSLWSALIVEELVRSGVDLFCVAPGSRSSPLTVAVARHPRARSVVHYDERGVAFHALGFGRATGRPAAVVTTSGSALANVWPAVVEASLGRVPLIVLSGDRPPELQDAGANQTMDQVKFFGNYVRWCASLPCPDTRTAPTLLLTTVDQAVYRAGGFHRGPVHLNFMYREPLAPVEQGEDFGPYLQVLAEWFKDERPYTQYRRSLISFDHAVLREVAALANEHARGLIVAGHLAHGNGPALLVQIAERLKWPVFPDITSGLRLGHDAPAVVPYFDTLLASADFVEKQRPDIVVHAGGPITSKRLLDYLEQTRPRHYLVVEDCPGRQDPLHAATLRLDMPVAEFGGHLLPLLSPRRESSWLSAWQVSCDAVRRRMDTVFRDSPLLTEPAVARLVSNYIGSDEGLFLASSMPVRDMDAFAVFEGEAVPVEANRGTSGIDGTLASAAGFARGLNRRVTLLIGDLAFLHDINSLGLLKTLDPPMVIVLLNNNGGGIFSFLPIAEHKDVFESHFAAPHGFTFAAAAALFELDYACPASVDEFVREYERARCAATSTLIEVSTDRQENVRAHRILLESMVREIDEGR